MHHSRSLWILTVCLYCISLAFTVAIVTDLLRHAPPSARATLESVLTRPENMFVMPDALFAALELTFAILLNAPLCLVYVTQSIDDAHGRINPIKQCLLETGMRVAWLVLLRHALTQQSTLAFVCLALIARLVVFINMRGVALNVHTNVPQWQSHVVIFSIDTSAAWTWVLALQFVVMALRELLPAIDPVAGYWSAFSVLFLSQLFSAYTANGSFFRVVFGVVLFSMLPQLTDSTVFMVTLIDALAITTLLFFTSLYFLLCYLPSAQTDSIPEFYQHGLFLFLFGTNTAPKEKDQPPQPNSLSGARAFPRRTATGNLPTPRATGPPRIEVHVVGGATY